MLRNALLSDGAVAGTETYSLSSRSLDGDCCIASYISSLWQKTEINLAVVYICKTDLCCTGQTWHSAGSESGLGWAFELRLFWWTSAPVGPRSLLGCLWWVHHCNDTSSGLGGVCGYVKGQGRRRAATASNALWGGGILWAADFTSEVRSEALSIPHFSVSGQRRMPRTEQKNRDISGNGSPEYCAV